MISLPGLSWMWAFFFFGYALDICLSFAVSDTIKGVQQISYIIENENEGFNDKEKALILFNADETPEITRSTDVKPPSYAMNNTADISGIDTSNLHDSVERNTPRVNDTVEA